MKKRIYVLLHISRYYHRCSYYDKSSGVLYMSHIHIGSKNHMIMMPMNIFESAFIKALYRIEYLAGRMSREAPKLSIRRSRNVATTFSRIAASSRCPLPKATAVNHSKKRMRMIRPKKNCLLAHHCLFFVLSPTLGTSYKYSSICDSMECPQESRTSQTRNANRTLSPTSAVVCLLRV